MLKFEEIVLEGYVLSKGIAFGKPIFLDSKSVFEENKILNDVYITVKKIRR